MSPSSRWVRIPRRFGFTLLELLAVVAIIGLLVGLLLPAVQAAREAARRMSCSSHVGQILLGVTEYHDAFAILPPHGTGTYNDANSVGATNQFRLSFLVSILPFVEQRPAWNVLITPSIGRPPFDLSDENAPRYADLAFDASGNQIQHDYPAMGSSPLNTGDEFYDLEISLYRCPSDPGVGLPSRGRTNYAACLGDAVEGLDQGMWRHENGRWQPSGETTMRASGRGAWVPRMVTRLSDITDGLSATVLIGEIATHLGDGDVRTEPSLNNGWKEGGVLNDPAVCSTRRQWDPTRPTFWAPAAAVPPAGSIAGRGYVYADLAPLMSGFNTILPPNSELCLGGNWLSVGILPPSSRHPGGCHVGLADGAVAFITDSIEAGDSGAGSVILGGTGSRAPGSESPYGLWGAMGTRDGNEMTEGYW